MSAATRQVRGLYVLTPEVDEAPRLEAMVAAAIAGGAGAVQYRCKAGTPALRLAQARALALRCRAAGVPLIVNDDAELAARVGAAGVHVGADDATVAQAREAVGPAGIVGVSCYDDFRRAERAVAAGADYVAFGSFFTSPTKPEAVRADPQLIRRAKAQWPLPVVAIGGITAANADALIEAGVDAVAVISAVFDAPDIEAAARAIARRFADQRRAS